MAIRKIRQESDPKLRKKSKTVTEMNDRTRELIEDMIDTMKEADGAGLAAVQVGVLKRIFVVDVHDDQGPIVMINPEILQTKGIQCGDEGCLSIPGYYAEVERPNYVKVKFLNEEMEEVIMEGEELFARAVLHENDHLNGVLFTDRVKKEEKKQA